MMGTLIGIGVLAGVTLVAATGIRLVRPTEKGVIERLGKFRRVAGQGFNWIIPVIDQMIKVNVTERFADIQPREMITKDNLNARVDLTVYYKVRSDNDSVKKSVYNVDDFRRQIISLAQTTARSVIGDMKFEQVNSDRQTLNEKLRIELDEQTDDWGIEIVRVEMQEITPPNDVQETMNTILKAENEKDAAKDFAKAQETKADGERMAAIKRAEGDKQAEVLRAEGKAKAIELENQALLEWFKDNAIDYKKLETAERALDKGTKYVLGTDKDVQLVLSEAAGITPIEKKKRK